MITSKAKWLIWLQLVSLFLFLSSEVNGRRPCGRLLRNIKLPAHTKFASRQRKAGRATLACDKGYFFRKGQNTQDLSCTSLKNLPSDQIPGCKGCGDPPSLKNGTVRFPTTSVGSSAFYSCDVGFSLTGSRKQRKCRGNLRWSGGRSRISCQKNKCRDPGNVKIRNGNVTFSDKLFEEFSTISFKCNDGYELFGEEDIVCLNGKWSNRQLPFCRRKRCPKPDIPENGRIFGSKLYFIGSTVEFFCNSGFTLYGSRKISCHDDKMWKGTMAVCDDGRSHCRTPSTPIGAIKSGKMYNEGDLVFYTCKPGLKLFQGSQNRTCLKNKTWSGTLPKCVDEDYKVFPSINETVRLFKEGFVNSLLQTTCSGTNVSCPKPDARARALNLKYKGGLDLIFVLDTSSSITQHNFEIAREFVKTIVEIFGVDERENGDGTHIACVTYGTRAEKQFSFNEASVQTLEKALNKIDNILYTRGATATTLALELVRRVILPNSKRQDSTKALFLVTDGESNVGGSPKKAADTLKDQLGVEIYVIGIGKKVRDESLRRLASKDKDDNDKHVFPIKSYKDLNKVKKIIVNMPVKDYSECGASPYKPYDARARIVGGEATDERNWPWAVKIFVKGEQVCGGTLVNQEFVLTAAHCFDTYLNEEKIVAHDVQVQFQNKKKTLLTSLAMDIHPDYQKADFRNDITLLKIPKLNRFTKNQQAICLPREVNTTSITRNGNSMLAVGWGKTTAHKYGSKFKTEVSEDLKQVTVAFKANQLCANNVKNKADLHKDLAWYFNSTTQYCAGDITGKSDICRGDSGGPGMVLEQHPVSGKWRWFQVGIVSWGYGCAQFGEVSYYTKVPAFVDWIDEIVAKS